MISCLKSSWIRLYNFVFFENVASSFCWRRECRNHDLKFMKNEKNNWTKNRLWKTLWHCLMKRRRRILFFSCFCCYFFWRFSRFSSHRLMLLSIRCFVFEFFKISFILIMISNFDFHFFERSFWLKYKQSSYHFFFLQMQISFFCCWFRNKNERLIDFLFSSTTNVKLNIVFFFFF